MLCLANPPRAKQFRFQLLPTCGTGFDGKTKELEMIFYRQVALFDVYCTSICSRLRSVMFQENY